MSRNIALAVAWMSGALASFLSMALAGRELAAEVSLFQVAFMRSAACLVLLAVICARVGGPVLRTARPVRHVLRNTVHFGAQFAWYFGVASIPLAEVFAIEFTTPLWTAIIAAVFLGERFTSAKVVAIALGFLGVLVIVRPGLAIVHPAALAVLGAAIGYSITYVITKDMVGVERPLTILLWMNLVQLPFGMLPSLFLWVTPPVSLWPWVVVLGIAGLSSHYCITRALAHADASVVVPLEFLRVPIGALVAWWLYAEGLDPFVFVGALFIVAGNWINLRGAGR